MMDFPLTLPHLLRRAETYFGDKEIVTRLPDKSFHRYTYRDLTRRAKQLAVALRGLGLERGDRVGTLCWNHHQHMECYFGIPCGGFVLHTLNLRLHPSDLAYIARHGGDRAVVVDRSLVPLLDQFRGETAIEHVLVVEDSYEELLAGASADDWRDPELDEDEAAAMCYTSGTTGRPKGVVYSHRSTVLHAFGVAAGNPLGLGVSEADTILPVVPMFHANAWGYPYLATLLGAKIVYPGPHLDPESLLEDFEQEGVTWAAGVPTIWLGILAQLDADPGRWDLSKMKGMLVGGSAAPRAMIAGFKQRHGLSVVHGWGMTETSPVASVAALPGDLADADEEEQFDYIALQGLPLPFVELRGRDAEGKEIPWDDETMGELEIRGPWVAAGYYDTPAEAGSVIAEAGDARPESGAASGGAGAGSAAGEAGDARPESRAASGDARPESGAASGGAGADRWTDDGWFRTGDIVSIHPRGFVRIQDRTKDVIKSGGEWISSVALENALMGHPAVAEAAVIAVPDEKWDERPLAVVVLREGASASPDELREFLSTSFVKWWLPDSFAFVDEIPKTAVGKFRKTALREMFAKPTVPAP
jgi:fatty-acyl-CoA synthase